MLKKIVFNFVNHWPKVLFIFVIFFFFYPFFLKGKVPLALDIPTGMYYPWLNDSYGYPVKVPVKNSLLTDTISQFWIWRNWAVEGLKSGEIKIWNPMSLSGYEMSPWFHTLVFSPLNLLYFLTNKVSAMSWIVISQVIISLFSSHLFAKALFKQNIPAVYFALVWTFSSYFVGWLTWGTISHTLASLPLILYFVIISQKSWLRPLDSILYFFSLCLFFLSGHPQTIAYCLFIWVVFVLVGSKKAKVPKYILRNLSFLLLAVVFLAPAILPSIKVVTDSVRSQDSQLNSVNFGLVPVSKVLALNLTPNFYGNPATGNYFGGGYNFQEKLVYFGAIPLFLSVFALVNMLYAKKKNNLLYFGLFFSIFGLLISTEGFFGKLIYEFNIPILSSSPAGRGLIIYIFGVCILSGLGLSLLINKNYSKKSFFVASTILFFCYLFCFSIIKYAFVVFDQATPSMQLSYSDLKVNYTTLFRNLFLSFGIFILFWLSLSISIFTKRYKVLTLIVIIVLTLGDSYLFFKKYTPFTPPHLYFPETSSIKYLKSKIAPNLLFRIERQSGEVMPPNMWEPYGLSSLSGYDPMASKSYQSYLLSSKAISDYSRYVELGEKLDQLNHLGVKYFMVLKRNKEGIIDEKGELPYYVDHSKWKEVATDGPISILENQNFKVPYKLKGTDGTPVLINQNESSFVFEVQASMPGEFILYQNFNSNWSAKVNGNNTKISIEDGTFMNIQIPAGKSLIELEYKSRQLHLGLQLSAIGLLVLYFVIYKFKV